MDKKTSSFKSRRTYDDKEDLEIKEVAYLKTASQKALFCVLLVLFGIVLGTTFLTIKDYMGKLHSKNVETLKIEKDDYDITIVNNTVEEDIDLSGLTSADERVLEKINYIEVENKSNVTKSIKYDVKLNIVKNEFAHSIYSSNDSDILVRFSYSNDKSNWNYIKNSISTTDSVLNVLMGDYYDISGIEDSLRVVTNKNIDIKAHDKEKIYWRMELYYQNKQSNNTHSKFNSVFKIDLVNND